MIWIGTSGYNYPEWKGSFYPTGLAAAKMLPYYAARFPTVEINYTFYRMPTEKLVEGWATQTPAQWKITLKAPRRITHDSRLKNTGDLVAGFCRVAGTLATPMVYHGDLAEHGLVGKVRVEIWDRHMKPIPRGVGFSRQSFSETQAAEWAKLVDTMNRDGTMKRLIAKYLPPQEAADAVFKP